MATSEVFGEVEALTRAESEQLQDFIKRAPHIVFGFLNKKLNQRDMCLLIDTIVEKGR